MLVAASLVLLTLGSTRAVAEETAECAGQRPSFDGTRDLRYVQVGGEGHAYIHPTHPSLCPSPDVGSCDRPESDSVPGFAKLRRVPLPIGDVNRLLLQVDNFSHPLTPTPEQSWVIQPDGIKKLQPCWFPLSAEMDLHIWQYEPAVDIDNDGHPANLVVWRADEPPGPVCGEENGRGIVARSAQFAYFLAPGNTAIDVARTKATFERPPGAVPDPNHRGFNPIGLDSSRA